jgi:hypothetical protein
VHGDGDGADGADEVVAVKTLASDLERGVGESGQQAGRHARQSIRRLSSAA